MTDDLERSLSEALKDRAVVDRASVQSVLDTVSTLPDPRSAGSGTGRLAAAAAVIVGIAVLGVAIGVSNRFVATPSLMPVPTSTSSVAPLASDTPPGPVTALDEDGMFRLILTATRSSQASGTPIDVLASLTYLGPEASILARSGDRLVYFYVQRDGDPRIGGPWLAPCFAFPMIKGQPVEYRLTRAVPGFENIADSSLRLPEGIWHIRATAAPSVSTCGPDARNLATEMTIEVLRPGGTPIPSPSATPVRSDPGPS